MIKLIKIQRSLFLLYLYFGLLLLFIILNSKWVYFNLLKWWLTIRYCVVIFLIRYYTRLSFFSFWSIWELLFWILVYYWTQFCQATKHFALTLTSSLYLLRLTFYSSLIKPLFLPILALTHKISILIWFSWKLPHSLYFYLSFILFGFSQISKSYRIFLSIIGNIERFDDSHFLFMILHNIVDSFPMSFSHLLLEDPSSMSQSILLLFISLFLPLLLMIPLNLFWLGTYPFPRHLQPSLRLIKLMMINFHFKIILNK